MELTIETDDTSASILKDIVPSFSTGDIEYRLDERNNAPLRPVERRTASYDRRSRLYCIEFSSQYLILAIPVTYVVRKLLDPVLDELGKSMAEILKAWIVRQKQAANSNEEIGRAHV